MPEIVAKAAAKTKTVPYDVAEQLRTPEEMAAYLDAWFAEAPGDFAGIARALGDLARAKGMSQVARDAAPHRLLKCGFSRRGCAGECARQGRRERE